MVGGLRLFLETDLLALFAFAADEPRDDLGFLDAADDVLEVPIELLVVDEGAGRSVAPVELVGGRPEGGDQSLEVIEEIIGKVFVLHKTRKGSLSGRQLVSDLCDRVGRVLQRIDGVIETLGAVGIADQGGIGGVVPFEVIGHLEGNTVQGPAGIAKLVYDLAGSAVFRHHAPQETFASIDFRENRPESRYRFGQALAEVGSRFRGTGQFTEETLAGLDSCEDRLEGYRNRDQILKQIAARRDEL